MKEYIKQAGLILCLLVGLGIFYLALEYGSRVIDKVEMVKIPDVGFILNAICITVVAFAAVYITLILLFARSDLNTFYVALPANRFAFVQKGGKIVRIIYNSESMKLVDEAGFPMGKFVDKSDPRPELQRRGFIEELFGVWWVGIPYIHELRGEKLSWIDPEDSEFKIQSKKVFTFAITKNFGFKLEELTLGSSNQTPKGGNTSGAQTAQGITVDILLTSQVTIRDPHKAIIETDWMEGVESKLSRNLSGSLGNMTQDSLIAQKKKNMVGGVNKECDLVQAIIDDVDDVGNPYGVELDTKRIVYRDYHIAGDPEQKKRVNEANTKKFEKDQEAAGIKAVKQAEQEDMRTQQAILMDLIAQLQKDPHNMSAEQAERVALQMLRTKALATTELSTLVEGGASVTAAISTDGKGKGGDRK